jgi:hypothetical protein
MPILSAIGAGFGSDKVSPRYLAPGLRKPLINLGKDALSALGPAGAQAQDRFNAGTAKQEGFMAEQEGLLRNLMQRRAGMDPTQLLKNVGETAFSFINPSVVSPLAKFDVNYAELGRRAAGLNPAVVDSTANRLRDARIASGRFYDVARQAYAALPNLYNQVFNAGMASDDAAAGYMPQIMQGWRRLDRAPLDAAMLRAGAADAGSGTVTNLNNGLRSGVYGYQQERNILDRLGAVDTSMWNSLKDAIQMAGSVYGMVGGMGGMGGGGGGGVERSPESTVQTRFIPNYNPGSGAGYSPEFYSAGPQ